MHLVDCPGPPLIFFYTVENLVKVQLLAGIALAVIVVPVSAYAQQRNAPQLDLSYERVQLENGLTVLVHEDHSAPLVSIAMFYHVGSRNEPAGRAGFAHLFEHLMFNGSEHFNGEWFTPMQAIGASGVNGSTWLDRTEYHETVPTPALDNILWLESDRMGHLLGAIDQAKLNEQRGVVQNEKRQGDNQPYGRVNYNLYEGLFPPEHPYHHATIGSMVDLDAASLDDVRAWFRAYYGPNNAVVVLSGDVSVAEARERVRRYFGDIPPGPTVDASREWLPVRQHDTREVQYDDVPAVLADRVWAVPAMRSRDSALLDIAARILGGSQSSRLYRELVHDREVASSVQVSNQSYELASVFEASIMLRPGQDQAIAGEAVDRIVAQFVASGPTREEMQRAVTAINAGFVRSFQTGGAIAQSLAEGELYAGRPDFANQYLAWINSATQAEVQAAARQYLSRGSHEVDVLPRPTLSHNASVVDRSALPRPPTTSPDLVFPAIHTATLSNGARLVVAERHNVPAVQVSVQFDAGFAADSGGKLGVAAFASDAMDQGTTSRDALAIAAESERLGASVSSGAGLDSTSVDVSALRQNLQPSLDLWGDVVMHSSFPADAVERLRHQQIAGIAQEQSDPGSIAFRLLPPILYGQGHAYAIPFTGSGTEASTRAITRDDLVRFRDTWIRPDNATIFVVGDTTMEEIQPMLERALRGWHTTSTPLPHKNVADVIRTNTPRVIIVDRPGAPQSLILAGEVAPRASAPNDLAINAMNDVLGGDFTSRLNMNLRENKHWAYGAGSGIYDMAGPRPFIVRAPVQTDHTGDSMREILSELIDINGAHPITQGEMTPAVQNNIRRLPSALQTQGSVLFSMQQAALLGRPLDYDASLPRRYQALTLQDLQSAAREVVHPESLTWIVVGDRTQIEPQIRALNIAPIEIMNADGQPVH